MERFRRMVALDEIDRAEAVERLRRRKWAINAIEEERNERLSANFLNNLTSTNWFHEAISSQNNKDYDVVCPYYKLGCRVTCKKSDIESHVKNCTFGLESSHSSNSEVLGEDYEVVCPNSVLGCKYIGGKKDLQLHLEDGCAYKGKTRQEEQEERHLMRQTVINDCEEERLRRLNEDKKNVSRSRASYRARSPAVTPPPHSCDHGSTATYVQESGNRSTASLSEEDKDACGSRPCADEMITSIMSSHAGTEHDAETEDQDNKDDQQILTLHLLMEKQMNHVVTGLHNEVLQFWEHWREKQNRRRPAEVALIQQLQHCVRKLWNFASLEPFGSWATGLPGVMSDIDLVVCFEDDILLTKTPTSRNDLLRKLAQYLEKNAKSLITINKVLLHTRVPLIKASARVTVPCHLSKSESGAREMYVELDISIDGPEHSGLATTSLSQHMLKALPGLGPATMLIKEYLKEKKLCDSFTGGLASYGIFLLVSLLFLRRYHANQLTVEEKHPSVSDGNENVFSTTDNEIIEEGSGLANSVRTNSPPPTTSTLPMKHTKKSRVQGQGQNTRSRTLDKSFSSEFAFSDLPSSPTPPPPPPSTNTKTQEGDPKSTPARFSSSAEPGVLQPELSRSSSDPSSYSFINVKQQKEYGRRVAAKLLLNPADYDNQDQMLLDLETSLAQSSSPSLSESSDPLSLPQTYLDDPDHPLKSPMLGVIIVEFLGVYGEELQCGRHGFSVRDGGFRFDVQAGPYTVAHPQANDPLLVEDPVNVMNNVAKNCFNALAVQRVFLEAHDKFKSAVTRYSGRPGSALHSLAKDGSVIHEVFGLSMNKASDEIAVRNHSNPSSDVGGSCPNSPIRSRDYLNSTNEILLYRKRFPGMSAQEASEMLSTLPKQLLDDIVRSKQTSAGVILGVEFQKVLHEMLLNQQSGGCETPPPPPSSPSPSEMQQQIVTLQQLHLSPAAAGHKSPGRTKHKSQNSPGRKNSAIGIASSPKISNKKKKSLTKNNTCSPPPADLDPNFDCDDLSSSNTTVTNGVVGSTRPPKKRSSYTARRPPTGIAAGNSPPRPGKGVKGRSESF